MPPPIPSDEGPHTAAKPPAGVGSGARLVVVLLVLGVTAGIVGVLYQREQTRRCLAFYGAEAARMVASAPVVELVTLGPGPEPGVLVALESADVSQAPGLVHLRRGLVEDANFRWEPPAETAEGRLPAGDWDRALVFSDPAAGRTTVALVIDLAPASGSPAEGRSGGGNLAVVGRPGRMGLGRIARGLATWLAAQSEKTR